MKYLIRSGKIVYFTDADNKKEAWRRFFRFVSKNWERCKHSIGHLAELIEGNERYALRTVPAL